MKIIADMHTHTVASGHAFGTLAENAAAARKRGLSLLASTDHGPGISGASNLLYFRCASLAPTEIDGVDIVFGAELNVIDAAGNLDLDESIRGDLDFVLIAIHFFTSYPVTSDRATNTEALLAALARPHVDCLAHVVNQQIPVDLEALVSAAAKAGVIFEINNRSFIRDSFGGAADLPKLAQLCRQHDLPVVVTSDAHNPQQVGCFSNSLRFLEEMRFPEELVLNADEKRLRDWLAARHPNKRPREKVS